MKKSVLLIMFMWFGLNLEAQTGEVRVDIYNVVAEWGGSVSVGLFEKKGFPKSGETYAAQYVSVRDIKAAVLFMDVPTGDYAIAVYQDINSDKELNRNIYGQPTEPYAFSNNKFGRFGPPKFAEVAFRVAEGENIKLVINLKE